jgi:tetratricopeptide (TPR) repeat protein
MKRKRTFRYSNTFPKKSNRSFFRHFVGHEAWFVFIAAVICDLNSWRHQFVLDDLDRITGAPLLQSLSNVARIFLSPYNALQADLYRPLTTLSFAFNNWWGGANPDGYHVFNRVIHILVCLVIFRVLRLLIKQPPHAALLASLLFAVHPIQVEAITYINGRADSMAMLFFVLTWLFFIRERLPESPSRWNYPLSLVFYFFALLSKESAITWLGVALLTEFVYFSEGQIRKFFSGLRNRMLTVYPGYILVSCLYLGLRFLVLKKISHVIVNFLDNPLSQATLLERFLTGMKILFQSIALLLFPIHLSTDYSFNQIPVIHHWNSGAGLLVLLLTALLLILLYFSYGRFPEVFFGLGFFLITYFVVSNIVIPVGTIRADRLLYMPGLGILLVAGALLARLESTLALPPARNAFRIGVTLLIALLAFRTVLRNNDWKDPFTLFEKTAQTSPGSAKAHEALGLQYFNRKDYDRAMSEYQMAESIYPNYPELLGNIGDLYILQEKYKEAIGYLRRAVTMAPQFPALRQDLATALRKNGDFAGAIAEEDRIIDFYDELIRKNPSNPDHHYYKANALYFQGKNEEALNEWRLTLQLDPHYTMAQTSLTGLLRKLGRQQEIR